MLLNREEFLTELKDKIIVVNFTKVNGDKRDMRCTLDPKYLPPQNTSKTSYSKSNNNSISVWDVDANGWRSFILDSVNYVVLADRKIEREVHHHSASLKDIILSPRVGS